VEVSEEDAIEIDQDQVYFFGSKENDFYFLFQAIYYKISLYSPRQPDSSL